MPVNPLQITDPNTSDNPLSAGTSSAGYVPVTDADPGLFGRVADVVSGGVDRVSQWLAEQRAKSEKKGLWTGGSIWEGGHPTVKGVADAAQQVAGNFEGGIKAFHGSPHSFERFDPSKIGTGEGAQAYGHGLYFAENEGVARGYRDQLAGFNLSFPNKAAEDLFASLPAAHQANLQRMVMNGAKPAEVKAMLQSLSDGARSHAESFAETGRRTADYGPDGGYAAAEAAAKLAAMRPIKSVPTGHMYEVDINADPDRMLHWDKPLSEQSQHVRDALSKLSPELMTHLQGTLRGALDNPNGPAATRFATGDRIYRELADAHSRMAGDPTFYETPQGKAVKSSIEGAAQTLREAGIPGIRYLDQNSRAAGEGTHNLVMFDADTINLLRKYGIAGLIAGGGAAATQGNQ